MAIIRIITPTQMVQQLELQIYLKEFNKTKVNNRIGGGDIAFVLFIIFFVALFKKKTSLLLVVDLMIYRNL